MHDIICVSMKGVKAWEVKIMKVRMYSKKKLKSVDKDYLKSVVKMCSKNDELDYKAVCEYSSKSNLKGISVYKKGSKSLLIYIDLLQKKATYYKRGVITEEKKLWK